MYFEKNVLLVAPVLSPVGSFCAVIPVLLDCSLCNLLGPAIARLAGHNCSRLGHSLCSVSPVTPPHHRQRGGCPQCTQMWPKRWQL
jgi:hypothetical protein